MPNKYPDCNRKDRNCYMCSMSKYDKDCHGNPKAANALQAIRLMANMSQSELAKKTGINLKTLQGYESNRTETNKIPIGYVEKICNATDKTLDEFMKMIKEWD